VKTLVYGDAAAVAVVTGASFEVVESVRTLELMAIAATTSNQFYQ